ncbi:MAG: zf-HC2 domain-containing protein [Deltaproteobacteria bacterium]|nr:zf-HC2 domain-containing protein [Deltaproteobacteria bacterium]
MKDSCAKYSVDLSAYFDGELEAGEEATLKAHLEGCSTCRERLDKMNLIRSAMSGFGKGALRGQGSVLESLRAKLEEETGTRRKKNPLIS